MPLQRAVLNARTKELTMEDVESGYLTKEQARLDIYAARVPAQVDTVRLIRLLDQQQKWSGVEAALLSNGSSMAEFNAMSKLPFDDTVTDIIINELGYTLEQKKALFRTIR